MRPKRSKSNTIWFEENKKIYYIIIYQFLDTTRYKSRYRNWLEIKFNIHKNQIKAVHISYLVNAVLSIAKMCFSPEKLVSCVHCITLLVQPVDSAWSWSSVRSFFLGILSSDWTWDVIGLRLSKLCILSLFMIEDIDVVFWF